MMHHFHRFRRSHMARVLIIVQNLPVPLDRRVWLECQSLINAGYGVSVICPKGPGDPARQTIDGVRIYKYAPPRPATSLVEYAWEFLYCWLRTALLSLVVLVRDGFDVIQACNPPDTYWALARIYKLIGKRFVYDQHDLNPEVFRSRFGEPSCLRDRVQLRVLTWLERRTYRTADHVIATNDSYRNTAIVRGGISPHQVSVVRSGPNTARMRPFTASPELRNGRDHLLVYLGIMGPQDCVDIVLRVMAILVHKWGRRDVHAALLGFGDCYDALVEMADELGVSEYVTFTGRVGPVEISQYLSTAHIGVSPDPLSPLNDVSTMNKTMEYMSFALPVVAFDLTETRISGGDAVTYVEAGESSDEAAVQRFAAAVDELLDDPARRAEMALAGRRRAEAELDWATQLPTYVAVFDRLLGEGAHFAVPERPWTHSTERDAPETVARDLGRTTAELIDIHDDESLRIFGRTRLAPVPIERPAVSASDASPAARTRARVCGESRRGELDAQQL